MAKITQTAGRNALGTFAPEFAHFNDDVLFGENWNNEDIDLKTRSIITVVALMAQGITDSSLKFHLQNAKAHGVTQKEIDPGISRTGSKGKCKTGRKPTCKRRTSLKRPASARFQNLRNSCRTWKDQSPGYDRTGRIHP